MAFHFQRSFWNIALGVVVSGRLVQAAEPIVFEKQIRPMLEAYCLSCHGEEKPKGGLKLTTRAAAIKGGEKGTSLVAGQPDKSPLYTSTILPPDHDDIMPPKGDKLVKEQTEMLKQWIQEGAVWPEKEVLATAKRIDFAKEVQPILELSCVSCHKEGHAKGELRLDNKASAFQGGEKGKGIVPGFPEQSSVYTSTTLGAEHDDLMPPKAKGGPLPNESIEILKMWISQGARWPDGVTLTQKKAEQAAKADGLENAKLIHTKIVANSKITAEPEMKLYKEKIPGSAVGFEMIPIPSGVYTMGSPEGEASRKPDEGPQHKVKVEPFWMGKFEVTWNEFELFMFPEEERKRWSMNGYDGAGEPGLVDAVSRPTRPYVEMSFGMGKDGYPAISMTQHAANKYCQWLSAKTGNFYRLPTEAEWEYACRAGTTTAYSFGDDASKLSEYAWFGDNSDSKYQKVGKKKPNPWGLYDMHGNVAEWTLDQYAPDYYAQFKDVIGAEPWNKATKPYPHVARGGGWDNDPDMLRSAARRASDKTWKIQDPQLPKSIWYLTDAQFLGFRVVRPLKVPEPEQLHKYWTSGVERD